MRAQSAWVLTPARLELLLLATQAYRNTNTIRAQQHIKRVGLCAVPLCLQFTLAAARSLGQPARRRAGPQRIWRLARRASPLVVACTVRPTGRTTLLLKQRPAAFTPPRRFPTLRGRCTSPSPRPRCLRRRSAPAARIFLPVFSFSNVSALYFCGPKNRFSR